MLKDISLSRRLIGIVTVINLVVLILVGLIATNSNRRTLEAQATERFVEKNRQVTNAIKQELSNTISAAVAIQTRLSELSNYSQAQIRTSVRDSLIQDDDVLIHRVSIYRPADPSEENATDSVIVMQISTPRTAVIDEIRTFTAKNQQPASDAPMFTALQSNAPLWFVQDVAFEDRQGLGAVSIALPYTFEDEMQGVMWVDIPQPIFDNLMATELNNVGLLAETVNGFAFLVDENGKLLSKSGQNVQSIDENLTADYLARVDSQTLMDKLYVVSAPQTGAEQLVAVDALSQPNWRLVSILPRSDIPTPTGELGLQLILIAVVGISALALAVSYFTNSAIVEPVLNLSRAAQEIGSGDLRYHIDYRNQEDEIGSLARAMEGMKGNINHSYTELRNFSRTLENRVIERTHQLQETRQHAEETADELRAVYDESLLVVTEPRLKPILDAFAKRILSLMDASYCSVWLLHEDRQHLSLAATSQNYDAGDFMMDISQGMVGQSIVKQEAIVVDSYASYEHRVDLPFQTKVPYERAIVVPLMFNNKPMGALVCGRGADAAVFNDAEKRRIMLFANLVSPSVRNAQLFLGREQAMRAAEQANQVKTRFLASVTHELRTPLNLIINNMDFMRIGAFGDITDEQSSRLNQTVRSAEHLLYLINDLLDVSKIEAGEMQLFIQPSEIPVIIEDTVDSTYAYMEKMENKSGKVEIILDVEQNLPKIPMDARRIRQVLLNLMSNAVKFTLEGTVTLTVKAMDEGIFFAVKDTGIGVGDDERSVLFEAFERTREAKEHNIEGTGLGLPISQFLIRQHGGEIEVESAVGKGSTFKFTLPYVSPDPYETQPNFDLELLAGLKATNS